jgi:hypothetical protein
MQHDFVDNRHKLKTLVVKPIDIDGLDVLDTDKNVKR